MVTLVPVSQCQGQCRYNSNAFTISHGLTALHSVKKKKQTKGTKCGKTFLLQSNTS